MDLGTDSFLVPLALLGSLAHTRCLTDAWKLYYSFVYSLLACARRMASERRGEIILIQASDSACQV